MDLDRRVRSTQVLEKLGYAVFAVLENYYSNGEGRVGVRKTIAMAPTVKATPDGAR